MGVADLMLAGAAGTDESDAAVDAADASEIDSVLRLAHHEQAEVRRVVASTLPLLLRGARRPSR